MIEIRVYPALVPVFPDRCAGSERYQYTLCRNEALSVQVAYRITDGSAQATQVFPRVHTSLPVRIYHVGCVPVLHTDFSVLTPPQPIGMYPDVLQPKTVNPPVVPFAGSERNGMIQYREEGEQTLLCAYNDSWQSLWVAINEDGQTVEPGEKALRVEFFDENGKRAGETEVRLTVLNALLPAQTLLYTNWLHCDCLADRYGVELFSPRFYEILRDYLKKAARNGMNMVLLPAFTPPLDTPVGEERATAQLVDVTLENRRFRFDFTRMKEFLDVCREAGIGWFEHSHFFTQWGAKHAPKIMGNDNGIYRRLFGWETDAAGGEYTAFLRAYIPALKNFLREEGLEGKILFHISDEPKEENLEQYKLVLSRIGDLLEDCMVGDAVSDPLFCETGLMRIPIAKTRHAAEFVGKTDRLWCYYTGADIDEGMSNRLIQVPRERNRFLGTQLYRFRAQGFLHWGYNFYYGRLSKGLFDPFLNPCGGFSNAGTSYCVYPAPDGTAWQSVRQKIFADGLTDLRALQLLEHLAGREVCEEILRRHWGEVDFFHSPEDPESLLAFRDEVNQTIEKYSKPV